MRGSLSNVPHLQRGRGTNLLLHGEVPLVRDSRTDIRIPETDERVVVWVGRGRRKGKISLIERGPRQRCFCCRIVKLSFGPERRIERQAKIGSGSFEVGRKRVRATEHKAAAAGSIRKSDARLIIGPTS